MNMHPENPSGDDKPDALRELYHEAVAEDRGPSVQSNAAILKRARQRAEGVGQEPTEPMDKPAANDRFWLRHALGGLAAVGLVGWLMLQHAAWWRGPDKEGERDSRAEAVVQPAESQPTPAVEDADRAAVAESAPSAAALAQKSTEKKTRIQAKKTPEAMDMEASIAASAPVLRPEAAPAPGAAASARLARSAKPAAEAPSRSDETTESAAMAPQISSSSAQLPLCPLTAEVHGNTQAAKERADKASGIAGKPQDCRPRKHEETQPDDANPGWNASKYIADPPR